MFRRPSPTPVRLVLFIALYYGWRAFISALTDPTFQQSSVLNRLGFLLTYGSLLCFGLAVAFL